jgi:hypothetical protein
MRLVKRAAITVTPKQPTIDWANSLDEDGVKIDEDFQPERHIYLIGDISDVIPFDRDVIGICSGGKQGAILRLLRR